MNCAHGIEEVDNNEGEDGRGVDIESDKDDINKIDIKN